MEEMNKKTQDELTTEKFQQLLADNTSLQNTSRENYADQLAEIDKKFQDKLDKLALEEIAAERRYRDAQAACELAAQDYMLARRSIARERNEAGQEKNKARAELKGKYASYNESLQSERHCIFERYRNSGGGTHRSRGRASAPRLDRRQERRRRR